MVSTETQVAAITGAYGYLGAAIRERLEACGWRTLALVRTPRADDGSARRHCLSEPASAGLLDGVDLLVHCAYDFTLTRPDEVVRVNVEGSRSLLRAASLAGVSRVITISSMSAYPGTRQVYGRAKLMIESATEEIGGCVVRPGLVYGESPGGMVGALRKMVRLPVVPLPAGDLKQYLVHQDDLTRAVAALARAPDPPVGPTSVAHPTPVPFRTILETLARRDGRTCRFVAVPWPTCYWPLRLAEMTPLSLPFRADSLLGLVTTAPSPVGVERLAGLGVTVRPFVDGTR